MVFNGKNRTAKNERDDSRVLTRFFDSSELRLLLKKGASFQS